MKEFTTSVITVKNYELSSWAIDDIANDIETTINDYIENNWEVDKANEIPLEIRQKILRHVVNEMLDPDSNYEWD